MKKKMKAKSTIQKELRKCERIFMIRSPGLGMKEWEHELYGVQQALSWVLGEEVMPPVKSTQLTVAENEKGRSILQ